MKPVQPDRTKITAPADTKEVTYAEHQTGYLPLPALRTLNGRVVTQWELTGDERRMLAAGEPLIIYILTHNAPLQPICPHVGPIDIRTEEDEPVIILLNGKEVEVPQGYIHYKAIVEALQLAGQPTIAISYPHDAPYKNGMLCPGQAATVWPKMSITCMHTGNA